MNRKERRLLVRSRILARKMDEAFFNTVFEPRIGFGDYDRNEVVWEGVINPKDMPTVSNQLSLRSSRKTQTQ